NSSTTLKHPLHLYPSNSTIFSSLPSSGSITLSNLANSSIPYCNLPDNSNQTQEEEQPYTFRSRHTFGSNYYAPSQDTSVTPYTRLPVSTAISTMFTISAMSVATSAMSIAISVISVTIFAIPKISAITALS